GGIGLLRTPEIMTAPNRTDRFTAWRRGSPLLASSRTGWMRRPVRNLLKKICVALPILAGTACADCVHPASAAEQGTVRVAAAADLKFTMGEIVEAFRQERPAINVLVSYGS